MAREDPGEARKGLAPPSESLRREVFAAIMRQAQSCGTSGSRVFQTSEKFNPGR
jgi:hypothetical protein